MQALVPIVPYVEEETSSFVAIIETPGYEGLPPMHPPHLDVETLLFIAWGNMRLRKPNQIVKRGCFKCTAKDHWHRECPHEEK